MFLDLKYPSHIAPTGTFAKDRWTHLQNKFLLTTIAKLNLFAPITAAILTVGMTFDPFYSYHVYLGAYTKLGRGCHVDQSGQFLTTISFFVRVSISVVTALEAYRLFAITFSLLIYWCEIVSKCLLALRWGVPPQHFYKSYLVTKVTMKIWEDCLNNWIRLLLGCFFWVIVISARTVFKYNDLTFLIRWIFIAFGVVGTGAIYFLFSFFVGFLEESELLLKERGGNAGIVFKTRNEVILLRKRLRALKPIEVKCGDSFLLKKSTKTTFYGAVISRTVDILLM